MKERKLKRQESVSEGIPRRVWRGRLPLGIRRTLLSKPKLAPNPDQADMPDLLTGYLSKVFFGINATQPLR